MNAKLSKRLRAQARKLTVNLPARRLIYGSGSTKHAAVNAPFTTRGVYNNLKKAQRK